MHKWYLPILTGMIIYLTTACTTLELRIETKPTPDQAAISTLSSLILSATKNAFLATQRVKVSTPTPGTGTVKGKICYPSENTPAMTAYFMNVQTDQLIEKSIAESQSNYSVVLPPGKYYAYAWVPEYQVGGMYSKFIECGSEDTCKDHSPLSFSVIPGTILDGIDICDWVIPFDQLPISTPPANP